MKNEKLQGPEVNLVTQAKTRPCINNTWPCIMNIPQNMVVPMVVFAVGEKRKERHDHVRDRVSGRA